MLLVVRHAEAEVRVVGGPSESERPLTARGRGQAEALVEQLAACGPTTVWSSPYRRAFDTVVPTAAALGIEPTIVDGAREWDDGLETVADWLPLYERSWHDVDLRYGDGESHRELRARAGACLRDLLARRESGPALVASHGTWISRGLEALGAPITWDFWRAMPLPAVYELSGDGAAISMIGPGLS